MSYTRIKEEKLNYQKPSGGGITLREAVIEFIHTSCEELGFDKKIEDMEESEGKLYGTSLKQNQIPFNMQKDIDRLCMENAIKRFLDSGVTRDAFDVYFCFSEMFIGDYKNTCNMVGLLSEFENNGSSMLMKHRDHYVHSVYVFALGMAVFQTNSYFRSAYMEVYHLNDDKDASRHFIRYWGMAALFHDIGYPLELPFEQVASYFEVNLHERSKMPFMTYSGLDDYIMISDRLRRRLAQTTGRVYRTTNELFSKEICDKLGDEYVFTGEELNDILTNKPRRPDEFNYFMDHAYFSATILFKKLYEEMDCDITGADIDALTAIILHNSLYKFSIAHYKDKNLNIPLKMELHPIAYMLMLCDELQCWDRTAYGRNSRKELHPMDCNFIFDTNRICAEYVYDIRHKFKADQYEKDYSAWLSNKPDKDAEDPLYNERVRLWKKSKPRIKACSDMIIATGQQKCDFTTDIDSIINTEKLGLEVSISWEERKQSRKHIYLSDSNFLNLYYFAVALNGRWMMREEWKKAKIEERENSFLVDNMEVFLEKFSKLSLEYKLSNLNQAKAYDIYLNAIGCFYTDRPVDYPEISGFTEKECIIVGPMEHERWLREHMEMGWGFEKGIKGDIRENVRNHADMVPDKYLDNGELTSEAAMLHYKDLGKDTQAKDVEPMNAMLMLLNIFDGVRVYRL